MLQISSVSERTERIKTELIKCYRNQNMLLNTSYFNLLSGARPRASVALQDLSRFSGIQEKTARVTFSEKKKRIRRKTKQNTNLQCKNCIVTELHSVLHSGVCVVSGRACTNHGRRVGGVVLVGVADGGYGLWRGRRGRHVGLKRRRSYLCTNRRGSSTGSRRRRWR
jgi:hypothetical protein